LNASSLYANEKRRRLKASFVSCVLALLALLGVTSSAQAVRIATYNVENYLLLDRIVDGGYRKNYPKPEASKAALRAEIREVNADVLALQEMGGETFLRELQLDLKREGLNYPHAVVLDVENGRKLAILSKMPWVRTIKKEQLLFDYLGEKVAVKRGLLGVVFEDEKGEWSVFNVHLKAKFTDVAEDPSSAIRRLGEARAIRDEILKMFPPEARARYIVVGDFNDDPKSKPVQGFLKRGKTVLGHLLPTEDSRGERWTQFYHGKDIYSRVDYIIVSPEAEKGIKREALRILDRKNVASPRWMQPTDHRLVFLDWSPLSESR